jgi:hypothetical protein
MSVPLILYKERLCSKKIVFYSILICIFLLLPFFVPLSWQRLGLTLNVRPIKWKPTFANRYSSTQSFMCHKPFAKQVALDLYIPYRRCSSEYLADLQGPAGKGLAAWIRLPSGCHLKNTMYTAFYSDKGVFTLITPFL